MSGTNCVRRLVGFIGGGQMASAMAEGFIKGGLITPDNILVSDPNEASIEKFRCRKCITCETNGDVVKKADIIICAVKPNIAKDVILDIKQHWTEPKVFVSICAGLTTAYYQTLLGTDARIVRVMPNTPCLVGESASAYCCTEAVSDEDVEQVTLLMESCGNFYRVKESLMSAVTGVSGAGPAYIFMVIEALSDAGVKNGLPRRLATALAAQTVYGSAAMVLKTGEHPAILKEQVTSPGGCTIAGVAALEKGGLRSSIISAVDAAAARTEELGKLD